MNSRTVAGLVFGVAAAAIGGGWQVMTRLATTTHLAPADLAVLRYTIPALLLLPIALRQGLWPRQVPPHLLLFMFIGAGLPFGLVAMSGTMFAPAAHMGVMMAGASPLLAAALAWALWRDRPDRTRTAGLLLMCAGVALLGGKSALDLAGGAWRGDLLFLLAALLWAGYSLSMQRSGLSAWHACSLVSLWSALWLLPWTWLRRQFQLFDAPLGDLLLQALWQGVIAGVLGLWTFSAAIVRLGAAHAAAFGALAPVVSALGGWYLLGDPLGPVDVTAVLLAVAGVALASGAMRVPR